jgi:hypothetical protein
MFFFDYFHNNIVTLQRQLDGALREMEATAEAFGNTNDGNNNNNDKGDNDGNDDDNGSSAAANGEEGGVGQRRRSSAAAAAAHAIGVSQELAACRSSLAAVEQQLAGAKQVRSATIAM